MPNYTDKCYINKDKMRVTTAIGKLWETNYKQFTTAFMFPGHLTPKYFN